MTQHYKRTNVLKCLEELGYTMKEFSQFRWIGNNNYDGQRYFKQIYPDREYPKDKLKCICGSVIGTDEWVETPDKVILTLGSSCRAIYLKNTGKSCELCNAPHRNRTVNQCDDCRFPGEIRGSPYMSFGKHLGCLIIEIPKGYQDWILRIDDPKFKIAQNYIKRDREAKTQKFIEWKKNYTLSTYKLD
jgi:hypothetical protein